MLGFHRFGEEKALRSIATDASQQGQFFRRLDAFGDGLQAQTAAQLETRFENRAQVRITGGAGHE